MPTPDQRIELPHALIERFRDVSSVGVITGAGISAESGIRTYRGTGGVYDDPEEGERTVEALSGDTLLRDPDRTWRAVAALAREALDATPNAGHRALVDIEQHVQRFALLTQNVDGLHEEAGSRNVIAIHGSITATRCLGCGHEGTLSRRAIAALDAAPRCRRCGGVVRPGAVLFGEWLPPDAVERMDREFRVDPKDAVIAVGTTALFPYIAEPVLHARAHGRLTIEVNPAPTALSAEVDFALRGAAGTLLPALASVLGTHQAV